MWMTPDGRTHSNAHANPRQAVTERLWRTLVTIAEVEGASSARVMHDGFLAYMEDLGAGRLDLSGLGPELENQWIPDEYLDGEFASSAEVREYLNSVPVSWRVDAFDVVTDILEDLTAPKRLQRLRGVFKRDNR